MTSADRSYMGFAKQSLVDVKNTTDADYTYMLFTQGQVSAINQTVPLDQEIGGGAMLRDVVRTGVMFGGQVAFTPRPASLGMFLLGALGQCASRKNYTAICADTVQQATGGADVVLTGGSLTTPASATKVTAVGLNGAAGSLTVGGTVGGSADTEVITLTGVASSTGSKQFKTISRVEYPVGTGTMQLKATDGDVLTAAATLSTTPQLGSSLANPSPTQTVKVIGTAGAYGGVRVIGTDSTDAVIEEVIYCHPYELVEGSKLFTAVDSITVAKAAGAVTTEKMAARWFNGSYTHEFTLNYWDQFIAPYYSARFAPGGMWGEQYMNARFNALGLTFEAANFVRGSLSMLGAIDTANSTIVSTDAWGAASRVDGGPQFISPVCKIEVPDGTALQVLSGAMTMGMQIPLDEQFVVGSYTPVAFDINQRMFALNLNVRISSSVLYSKMTIDPTGAAKWSADMFREGNIDMVMNSDRLAAVGTPYSLKIEGNGSSGSSSNIVWSAAPLGVRAGAQVTMGMTGAFLADPNGISPIKLTLVNTRSAY